LASDLRTFSLDISISYNNIFLVVFHPGSKLAMLKHRKIFPIVLILTLLVLTIQCGGIGGGCSSGETGTINLAWDPAESLM